MKFEVVSQNLELTPVQSGEYFKHTFNKIERVNCFLEYISQCKPAIIMVQEAFRTNFFGNELKRECMNRLESGLRSMGYNISIAPLNSNRTLKYCGTFLETKPPFVQNSGLITASLFDIKSEIYVAFDESLETQTRRGFLVTTVEAPECEITVINTHLDYKIDAELARQSQQLQICKWAENQSQVLVGGDFNTSRPSMLGYVHHEPIGGTYPILAPDQEKINLDHFFTRGLEDASIERLNIKCKNVTETTIDNVISDHNGIKLKFL